MKRKHQTMLAIVCMMITILFLTALSVVIRHDSRTALPATLIAGVVLFHLFLVIYELLRGRFSGSVKRSPVQAAKRYLAGECQCQKCKELKALLP
jgi:uncharacterized membrane protein YozB (DUF420 family)